jgi:hypothetical protein
MPILKVHPPLNVRSRISFGTRYRRKMIGTVLTQDAGYIVWCYHHVRWFHQAVGAGLKRLIRTATRKQKSYEKEYDSGCGMPPVLKFGIPVEGFPKPYDVEVLYDGSDDDGLSSDSLTWLLEEF